MDYKKITDISIPLFAGRAVYPGDPGVEIEKVNNVVKDGKMLSRITLGMHSGTHMDAPAHCLEDGALMQEIPLSKTVGICRVLDFSDISDSIKTDDLKNKNVKAGERILVKTKNSARGLEQFYPDYVYLDGDAAEYLADLEISCFGIDAMSIKQRGSKDNRPHTALLSKNIPIIESINLKGVSEGEYFLICAPLKILGVEAAPVRALLLS